MFEVKIPDLLPKGLISKRYTCDGADMSLPVRWSHIPRGTVELVMFVITAQPVAGQTFYNWAVAGLKPTSHGVAAGRLPPGVVVGRNSYGDAGYSICPAKGSRGKYVGVRVEALSHPIAAKPGFDPNTLHQEAKPYVTAFGITGGEYERA
jgi:phosphatidylethanolamine-binding protein (PEBP) family uncharacterized protein